MADSSNRSQDDELNEQVERLREKFLEEFSESDEVDSRDLDRVRHSPSYVKKFLIQKMGNFDNAYEMMVGSFKWRKSVEIHGMPMTLLLCISVYYILSLYNWNINLVQHVGV
jgi:hypothetical protein